MTTSRHSSPNSPDACSNRATQSAAGPSPSTRPVAQAQLDNTSDPGTARPSSPTTNAANALSPPGRSS
ncbi:hypothetical protein ACQEVZ_31680 [Dactylosporangium sp. CA-152071]|uniref:hypothetical protein n=1 Tax=Dactylosporangium sp. CA-152071 TaxID=3239933 RepID=UPI003D8FA2F4